MALNLTSISPTSSRTEAISTIINNFRDLYNPPLPTLHNMDVFPTVMVPRGLANLNAICAALSIPNSSTIITYLGIPISFSRSSFSDFQPLMDNIRKKMSGWKANLLSLAGRLQFLKFTILNFIAYWIRGSILPKAVIKFITKCSSAFIFFGDLTATRKLKMVSWDKVCKPKSHGGLGIPSMSAIQFAYSCSVISRMYNGYSLLSSWLKHHYVSPWRPANSLASTFWKNLCRAAVDARKSYTFTITPSSTLSFFWDPWCNGYSIAEHLQGNLSNFYTSHNALVSDFTSTGNWILPVDLLMLLLLLLTTSPFLLRLVV
ncbi:hypothetical protein M5K25_012570 [Dendrobium thyrsiflorum]|uniref:Reverse transcriptase n=1 Tax=Dendrobium thyrsiflorum TaxID=117978 RepID=A0ABD0UXV3_DENTH